MRFPDLESLVIGRLPQHLATSLDWCATDVPEILADKTGVQILSGPGSDDGLTDSTLVDVSCFAPTRGGAYDLAEEVRAGMAALAATDTSTTGDKLIDRVETATRPQWSDYQNSAIHRVVASYRVHTRIQ